jgi:hypothetical protein
MAPALPRRVLQAGSCTLAAWASHLRAPPASASSSLRTCHGGRDEEQQPDLAGLMELVKGPQREEGPTTPLGAEARRALRDPTAMFMMGQGMPFGVTLKLRPELAASEDEALEG